MPTAPSNHGHLTSKHGPQTPKQVAAYRLPGGSVMAELHRLKTLLEGCFGDADDEEGLATLHQQLSIYPEDMAEFQADLDEILPDLAGCQSLLEN